MFNLSSHTITRCRKIVAVTLQIASRSMTLREMLKNTSCGMSDMDFGIVVSVMNDVPLGISITSS